VSTFIFYRPAGDPPVLLSDVAEAIASLAIAWDGPTGPYRPGRWQDAATGASAVIDLGTPPLEVDTLHPAKAYDGWADTGVTVHLPLAGPHWHAVEALRVVEVVLQAFPDWRALDTEDTIVEPGDQAGPFPWDRPRASLTWERQRDARIADLLAMPRMSRRASVALWRYRRERTAGQAAHPSLLWPEALVLLDRDLGLARSAALWSDPAQELALPPVELLVIPRAGGHGVLPVDEVLAAGPSRPIPLAGALHLPAGSRTDLFNRAILLPATRFSALDWVDWAD